MALQPCQLSEYELSHSIGAGATSRVLDAKHRSSGKRVAIKILDHQNEPATPELRDRVAREALLLAQVSSKHVGKLLGFGFDQGHPFLVLERLVGETIDDRLKREGRLLLDTVRPWIGQILRGLHEVHSVGIIHRDLKPANIFLQHVQGGIPVVKLIDFGLAKSISSSILTGTTQVLGSIGYMAPEQFVDSRHASPSTDLYAVGCVLFRILSGELPFMARSIDSVIRMKMETTPPLLSTVVGAPQADALDAFVAKAIHKDSPKRFQSANDMLVGWEAIQSALDWATGTERMVRRPAGMPVHVDNLHLEDPEGDDAEGEEPPTIPQLPNAPDSSREVHAVDEDEPGPTIQDSSLYDELKRQLDRKKPHRK